MTYKNWMGYKNVELKKVLINKHERNVYNHLKEMYEVMSKSTAISRVLSITSKVSEARVYEIADMIPYRV